jgi:hypothetical protein
MIDAKVIEDIRTQNPDAELHKLRAVGEEIVARLPTSEEWRRLKAMAKDPVKALRANEQLVRDCILYPDAAGLESIAKRHPASIDSFANKLSELAGGVEAESEKL